MPTTPSIKTREIILWEKAVNEQYQKRNSRKGMTYEEALDKQKSEQIHKGLQNTSAARILKKVERKFFK